MESNDSGDERQRKWLDVALATRQFEIDLFWKRALFFGGFIAAAFVALGTIEGKSPTLSLLASGLGIAITLAFLLPALGAPGFG